MYRDSGYSHHGYKDSYGINEDYDSAVMPSATAGEKYPMPGVSKIKPKYSSGRDLKIGRRTGVGHVNADANETPNWSAKDTAETGLTSRQPI